MKILVINTGSSSIKYKIFEMEDERILASGSAERIGEKEGVLTQTVMTENGEKRTHAEQGPLYDHKTVLMKIADMLVGNEHAHVDSIREISAIGHRVVHGGETFKTPVIIDGGIISKIRENTPLAPLHNPHNLLGVEIAREIFSESLQVAVFDTAFHRDIPEKAFVYALPYALYEKYGVRRYGFHGTSHSYISEEAAKYLGSPLRELNIITLHLGNGASIAAIKNGTCVDTSMGMTPLEGLVMGTRSGDIDPAIPFYLAGDLKMSFDEIDNLLNRESGLKGICGTNDMREILERKESGDEKAELAVDIYTYRIRKYLGAYSSILEDLNCVVFSGGIGENSHIIRELSCQGLSRIGISIDLDKNKTTRSGIKEISPDKSEVMVLAIPCDEELKIARETAKFINR